jgi:hypothetical protein
MKIIELFEQEDGSALVKLDLTADEVALLLERAIIDILKEQLVKSKTDLDDGKRGESGITDGSSE